MLMKMALEQKPQNKGDAKMTEKMLNGLKSLRQTKLNSNEPENDAEIIVIDKMIRGFEADLNKKA